MSDTVPSAAAAGESLDVRSIPPRFKHPTIMASYAGLQPGETFTIVNDHDPKPLHYQFQAEHPDAFTWEYQETGPEIWRVQIGKPKESQ